MDSRSATGLASTPLAAADSNAILRNMVLEITEQA
jgi:hypothetical protein